MNVFNNGYRKMCIHIQPINGRLRHNIRMNKKEMRVNTRNGVDSAQDRDYWRALMNATLNLWVP